MRRSVVLVILLFLGAPAQAGTRCDANRPQGPVGLPGAVFVKGDCGTFALRPDGLVERASPPEWAPPWAPDAQARAADGTYITHRRQHLVLVRDAETYWRSRLAHGSDNVAVHGNAIAFTAYEHHHPNVWVARVGGPERLAGRGEDLHGWARAGGFFTQRGIELRLRARDGWLVRHLEFVWMTAYDRRTQTLVAITTSDLLVRTDGRRTTILGDLVKLRLASQPWLEVLPSGLVQVRSDNRLLLLWPDGRRFASAALARDTRKRPGATIISVFLPLPHQRGVVFAVHRSRTWKGTGKDRILLLQRGHRVPRILYERRAKATACGYWANLSLHESDVLYWPSSGKALVAVDASGRRAPRDLWRVVRRIPGFRHRGRIHRAAWASAWNG